jgi:hypothetical protein
MASLNQDSAKQLTSDIAGFIRSTSHPANITVSVK